MPFVSKKLRKPVDELTVTDLNADAVRSFLADLEITRDCGIATRNQRLAAIHAFAGRQIAHCHVFNEPLSERYQTKLLCKNWDLL